MDQITFDKADRLNFNISILETRIREIEVLIDLVSNGEDQEEHLHHFRLEGKLHPRGTQFMLFEEEDLSFPDSENLKRKFKHFLQFLQDQLKFRLRSMRGEFEAL